MKKMSTKGIGKLIRGLARMYSEELESPDDGSKVMNQDELAEYCATELGGKWKTAKKVAWVKILEQANPGQKYTTITRDENRGDWVETVAIAKEGQYLVQNVYGDAHQPDDEKDPSKWLLSASQIEKNYELPSPIEVGRCYKPVAISRHVLQLNEPISFVASWGSQMNAKTGDWLVKAGEGDIYRIDKVVFFNTYEFGN